MSQPDIGKLMEQAQEVQSRLADLQRELAQKRVEGSAGGGMVTAVASGALRVLEIRIEPSLLEGGDRQRRMTDAHELRAHHADAAALRHERAEHRVCHPFHRRQHRPVRERPRLVADLRGPLGDAQSALSDVGRRRHGG